MTEYQLTLTAEERQYLLDLLQATLKDTLVEEHRTRTPSFRQHITRQEAIEKTLLGKLRQPPA